jgi:hypothetical protein
MNLQRCRHTLGRALDADGARKSERVQQAQICSLSRGSENPKRRKAKKVVLQFINCG